MKSRSAHKKGMTLIEVLIAMVILSLGVSSMLVAMSRCLSVVSTARNLDIARNLLRQVDIENPLKTKEMKAMTDHGSFEAYEGFTWEREIEEVDSEERPGLFIITTRVRWSQKGTATFEETIMYKYAPDAESVTSKI